MSTAFTSVFTEVDLWVAQTGIISELYNAAYERADIGGMFDCSSPQVGHWFSKTGGPYAGETYQRWESTQSIDEDYWDSGANRNDWRQIIRPLQENHGDNWVDFTASPYLEGLTAPVTFSESSATGFRSAAGLHASGFRRATEWDPDNDDWTDKSDAMYSYGYPAYTPLASVGKGDICGPWLIEDIQDALTALKWTYAEGSFDGSNYFSITMDSPWYFDSIECEVDFYGRLILGGTYTFLETRPGVLSGDGVATTASTYDPATYNGCIGIFKWDFTYSN